MPTPQARSAAIKAAAAEMHDLGDGIAGLTARVDRRDWWARWVILPTVSLLLLAIIVALVWLGVGVRENADAIKANKVSDQLLERDRLDRCVESRTQLVAMAHAVAYGSANGLHGMAANLTSSPESLARVDALIEQQYRRDYLASLLDAVPKPEDCD